jgi:hypothetical protein
MTLTNAAPASSAGHPEIAVKGLIGPNLTHAAAVASNRLQIRISASHTCSDVG